MRTAFRPTSTGLTVKNRSYAAFPAPLPLATVLSGLCDKISMSLGDLNGVADKLHGALAAHNEAVKRLSTGRGNVLSMGERIRGLGVKTRRPVPAMLVDGVAITLEAEEIAEAACAAESCERSRSTGSRSGDELMNS